MSKNFGKCIDSNPGGVNNYVVGEHHFKHTSLSSVDVIDRKCEEQFSTHKKNQIGENHFSSQEELLKACSEAENLIEKMEGLDVFGEKWLTLASKRHCLLEMISKTRNPIKRHEE